MLRYFYTQLPDFAQPSHPIMRYALAAGKRISRRGRLLRLLLGALLAAGMMILGWQIATSFGTAPLDAINPLDNIFLVLYWPLVIAQVLLRLYALGSTSGVISSEVQHGTWDTLKVTSDGAILTMKARWAAVFYRLQVVMALILLGRLFFVVVALINLTSFQGRYLDLLLSGTVPFGPPNVSNETAAIIGILIMSMMITASLLAPFTAVALDASVGMLLGTLSRGRLLGTIGQVVLMVTRILTTAWALRVGAAALSLGPLNMWPFPALGGTPFEMWFGAFLGVAEGDMGLTLLHLPHVQRLWADREYGVLVGIGFLGYTLLQAALANFFIKWAGRRATKADSI
jgi:hypothetical protein